MFHFDMLDYRKIRILQLLIQEETIKIDEIASSFNVSERTIHNDIITINESYMHDKEIVSKNKGVVKIHIDDKKKTKEEINKAIGYIINDDRRISAVIEQLINEETTTLEKISQELFISKTSVHQVLSSVEKKIKKFDLKLIKKPFHGIMLVGNEMNKRFLLKEVYLEDINRFYDQTSPKEIIMLNHIMEQKDISNILKIAEKYELSHDIDFILSLVIMINRINSHYNLDLDDNDYQLITNNQNLHIAKNMLNEIADVFKIEVHEFEVAYLIICLQNAAEYQNNNPLPTKLQVLVDSIIGFITRKYGIESIDDQVLYNGLIIHFSSAVYRISYNNLISNPLFEEVKEHYLFAFSIAADVSLMLSESFDVAMKEDEVSFIAMHIQAAIERNNVKRKQQHIHTILVCDAGFGTSQLLKTQLIKEYPELYVEGIYSRKRFNTNQNDIDKSSSIIISTLPLNQEKHVVLVNPILSKKDHESIKRRINQIIDGKREYSILQKFLDEEHIQVLESFQSMNECIENVCDLLYEAGYVEKEFAASVKQRENISSTYLTHGVALPHGFSEYVKKPCIALVTLKKPILWGENNVSCVLLCAMNLTLNEDDKSLFDELYELVNDEQLIQKIISAKSIEQIKSALNWNYKEGVITKNEHFKTNK